MDNSWVNSCVNMFGLENWHRKVQWILMKFVIKVALLVHIESLRPATEVYYRWWVSSSNHTLGSLGKHFWWVMGKTSVVSWSTIILLLMEGTVSEPWASILAEQFLSFPGWQSTMKNGWNLSLMDWLGGFSIVFPMVFHGFCRSSLNNSKKISKRSENHPTDDPDILRPRISQRFSAPPRSKKHLESQLLPGIEKLLRLI